MIDAYYYRTTKEEVEEYLPLVGTKLISATKVYHSDRECGIMAVVQLESDPTMSHIIARSFEYVENDDGTDILHPLNELTISDPKSLLDSLGTTEMAFGHHMNPIYCEFRTSVVNEAFTPKE